MRLPLCLVPVLAASTLAAHADVVNFDLGSVPSGATAPFTLTNDGLAATIAPDMPSSFLLNPLGHQGVYLFANFEADFSISFSSDLSALALEFSTNDPFSATAFDLYRDGVLVGTQLGYTPPASGGPGFGTANLTGDFDQVVVNTAAVGSFTATTATPEPSTFALLGTGMLGTAGALRRKLVRP